MGTVYPLNPTAFRKKRKKLFCSDFWQAQLLLNLLPKTCLSEYNNFSPIKAFQQTNINEIGSMINTMASSILWCLFLCFLNYCSISDYPEVCIQANVLQQDYIGMAVLALLFVNYFLIANKPFLSLFLLCSWATSGENRSLDNLYFFFFHMLAMLFSS